MRVARVAVIWLAVTVALWSATAQSHAQVADSMAGTWTLDLSKSKYSPGPAPESSTMTVAETADEVKLIFDAS